MCFIVLSVTHLLTIQSFRSLLFLRHQSRQTQVSNESTIAQWTRLRGHNCTQERIPYVYRKQHEIPVYTYNTYVTYIQNFSRSLCVRTRTLCVFVYVRGYMHMYMHAKECVSNVLNTTFSMSLTNLQSTFNDLSNVAVLLQYSNLSQSTSWRTLHGLN